jgi:hypothetical protein
MTYCRSGSDALNVFWIWGSATLTIVTSSSIMNMPATTAVSVHHVPGHEGPSQCQIRIKIT